MFSEYITKNHQKLRCGYTTGSCAAAAAKAAARMLLTGETVSSIPLMTPKGIPLTLEVLDPKMGQEKASCAIRKDAGDDADQTDGMLIYAEVSYREADIIIDGGVGIGRITKPGLEQPIGAAAINQTPRQMIRDALLEEQAGTKYQGGFHVLLFAPQGEETAKKTLGPELGIEGGISILGTSGIVEPMSEQAILDTIRIEIHQKKAQGEDILFLSPGNYGQAFARETWGLDLTSAVKCSNFIGDALDSAVDTGFHRLLLIGHIGKLVKLGAGIMNTHSRMADARMETLCACALLAGADADIARSLLACTTTDNAAELLQAQGLLAQSMDILLSKIIKYLNRRAGEEMQIEVVLFSNLHGILAASPQADNWISAYTQCKEEGEPL